MPYSLEPTWSSASADELYVVARLAPKPDGFEEKMNHIRANDPQLTHLDLSEKGLSSWNVIELFDALATNTTLISLDVSRNRIGTAGAQALAANTTLTSLDVSSNQIGSVGAQALATNTRLTSLNVSLNHVGTRGAQALAANTTLRSLNVSSSHICTVGAQALAANTTLTVLDVSQNWVGSTGARALAANTTLISLDATRNYIEDADRLLLTNAIIRNIEAKEAKEAKKTMVRLHAFASIANNYHLSPSFLPEDIVQEVGSFLTTDAGCLTDIRLRAETRSSRHVLFQPVGTVDSTIESIQSAHNTRPTADSTNDEQMIAIHDAEDSPPLPLALTGKSAL